MKFRLIIPGKNWRLSLAELTSLFETRGIKFFVYTFSKNFFVVGIEEVDASIIDYLGGIIKIGVSATNFSTKIVKRAFLQEDKRAKERISKKIAASGLIDDIVKTELKKIIFGVSVYCAEKSLRSVSKTIQRFVGSSIKKELAGYGKKSKFMGFAKNRRLPQLSHVSIEEAHG